MDSQTFKMPYLVLCRCTENVQMCERGSRGWVGIMINNKTKRKKKVEKKWKFLLTGGNSHKHQNKKINRHMERKKKYEKGKKNRKEKENRTHTEDEGKKNGCLVFLLSVGDKQKI